jgi:5-methylcytosine-specific restriction endonuclease McrA
MSKYSLTQLPDHVLVRDLRSLVARERVTTAELLAHLAEVDARRLYLPAGYTSMYSYCVGELKFSEDAAAKRIRALRVVHQHPAICEHIADGRLHLSGVVLLSPHLTPDNARELLEAASHQTKAGIEALLAARFPRPDVETLLQPIKWQAAAPGCSASSEGVCESREQQAPGPVDLHTSPARVTPLAPERFALQVTLDQETHDLLRQAQALLGHAVPSGNVSEVLKRSLQALVRVLEKRKFAATERPRARRSHAGSRYIPAEIRREVHERDCGQCTFAGERGHRCDATRALEFDHMVPVAKGGRTCAANLRLRCRAHNQYEAERTFGAGFMKAKREAAQQKTAPPIAEQDAAKDVAPWLRSLGFRAEEIRAAAKRCEAIPDASIEERVRFALTGLAPRSARHVMPVANAPA